MRYETVSLPVPGTEEDATLTVFAPDNYPELGLSRRRTALILCPGGGYYKVSDREGEPVALRFAGLGYAVFWLKYQIDPPGLWPIPQRQLFAAIDFVRRNSEAYHVDPSAVVVLGFSAGGHLAACAGTLWTNPEIVGPLKRRPAALRPDGMVLCYPVITSGPYAHQVSFQRLLGERYEELKELVSLEKQVRRRTPPTFLWHTADDTSVPRENSLLFEQALKAKKVPVELHIYPHGSHGQSLADDTVYSEENLWKLSVPCGVWVEHCHQWLKKTFGREART